MKTTAEVRQTFLDFFKRNGHEQVESSPLVPHNDPTLMFTNAGMNQFKNIFTGLEKRPYTKATSSQKCVRAGGKHNDLDNVGYTARHHTFFEMLGNFSFGDYFKEQAISYAWELITKGYGLPKNRLCATVYGEDEEAYKLWKKIAGLPDDRVIKIYTHDNFWAMGDTGPCGPCSEIFYDHGDNIFGGPPGSKDEDGDRYIEIWNLVFMQYEQRADGSRVNLPRPSIDTGMGLERITAVLQGVHNNYDIDLFKNLITNIGDKVKINPFSEENICSCRVIADHLRSGCFLIADGVTPSKDGRGYVLRRILRRAMRHASLIGAKEPLMYKLVPSLIAEMGDVYPELIRAEELIKETLEMEEINFRKTLDRGLKLLDSEIASMGKKKTLSGEVAFKLYDTYGFPLDLTQDALRPKNISVDVKGFDAEMEKQRKKARENWAGSGEKKESVIWFDLKERLGATDFLGYTYDNAEGKILAIVKKDKEIESAKKGDEVYVITNQTPFYGECGGQLGDKGEIVDNKDLKCDVIDAVKYFGDFIVHKVVITEGTLKKDMPVILRVNKELRKLSMAHHSATHLLQAALRQVLGTHVNQKGSQVGPDGLRFDFSHTKQVTPEELQKVEDIVNAEITKNEEQTTAIMSHDEAVNSGAMALFGEKYGDEVRVVSFGSPDHKFSVELCGGTHVKRTGDIGYFKITSEGSIASGIRRITAVVSSVAAQLARDNEKALNELATMLKTTPGKLTEKVSTLLKTNKNLEAEIKGLKKKLATGDSENTKSEIKNVGKFSVIFKQFEDMDIKELRTIADEFKEQIGAGIVILANKIKNSTTLLIGVTKSQVDFVKANEIVKTLTDKIDGIRGGGKPEMAQAGGDIEIDTAMQIIEDFLLTK